MTRAISDFNNPSGSRLGLFTAIQNIGGICALLFSSYAADLFGRRVGVCLGLLIVFLGTILQGQWCKPHGRNVGRTNSIFSAVLPTKDHEGMFIGGRFLVGLG
jgi:MFS family permease